MRLTSCASICVVRLQLRLVAARGLSGGQEAMWVELGHVKNATDILLSKAPRVRGLGNT
jgi:hypothetical protein